MVVLSGAPGAGDDDAVGAAAGLEVGVTALQLYGSRGDVDRLLPGCSAWEQSRRRGGWAGRTGGDERARVRGAPLSLARALPRKPLHAARQRTCEMPVVNSGGGPPYTHVQHGSPSSKPFV